MDSINCSTVSLLDSSVNELQLANDICEKKKCEWEKSGEYGKWECEREAWDKGNGKQYNDLIGVKNNQYKRTHITFSS